MPQQETWRPAQIQAVLAPQAWARRLRRLTPLSQPWRDVLGEEFVAGMECRGLRHGTEEIVVAVALKRRQPVVQA